MRLSAILDPIDARAFMPEREATNGGIRISNSAVAILLFLFAQTVGAVWWASAMNEKMNQVNGGLAAQARNVAEQRSNDLEQVKDLKLQIEFLKTYNQKTREQFALNGWILSEDGTLRKRR